MAVTAAKPLADVTVLIVDDDADQVFLTTEILVSIGAHVFAATSVEHALLLFARHRPSLIVSDLSMPENDGFAFLRIVRARSVDEGGQTPAIAVSGRTLPEERTRAYAAGFQVHLPKPLQAADLIAHARRLVGV